MGRRAESIDQVGKKDAKELDRMMVKAEQRLSAIDAEIDSMRWTAR